MVCPYNDFKECFEENCPAHFYRGSGDGRKGICRYIAYGLQPPNKNVTNNYYNREKEGGGSI